MKKDKRIAATYLLLKLFKTCKTCVVVSTYNICVSKNV